MLAKRPVLYRACTLWRTLYLSSGSLLFCTIRGCSHSGCWMPSLLMRIAATLVPCRLFSPADIVLLEGSAAGADGTWTEGAPCWLAALKCGTPAHSSNAR